MSCSHPQVDSNLLSLQDQIYKVLDGDFSPKSPEVIRLREKLYRIRDEGSSLSNSASNLLIRLNNSGL
ncbi:hypothetical protein KKC45_02895 [Patescibacteria group bacterium]|nr:hypothetical protein [Patescibacteria group bacterium]